MITNQEKTKDSEIIHIPEKDLAKRWGISPKTLQRWRWINAGPTYIKIGNRIRYPKSAIEKFENNNIHTPPCSPQSMQEVRNV